MSPASHNTLRLNTAAPQNVAQAAALLRAGRLVAFATETVYGLGANALDAAAVAGIFVAKQRPAWDPLIVHLASAEQLAQITAIPAELVPRISQLVAAFWPGPLTLLLPKLATVPDAVTAGRPLVGVRVPSHPAAQALLAAVQLPIAAPSANRFGHTSPTTAAHVLADLDGRIDAVLDAGPTAIGVESTVLDPTQTPMVLYRPGAITAAQLESATGVAVHIYVATGATPAVPASLPSPGVGIRHYAPRATFELTAPSEAALLAAIRFALNKTTVRPHSRPSLGVLLPADWSVPAPLANHVLVESWSRWEDAAGLAAGLFAALRSLDERGAVRILAPLPAPGGLRDAIRDRMEKAARSA
jgi:L-threonylcarbamoyladenylate synthase